MIPKAACQELVERAMAERHLKELRNRLAGQPSGGSDAPEGPADLMGKTWVTRVNVFVDRIACGWLIRPATNTGTFSTCR